MQRLPETSVNLKSETVRWDRHVLQDLSSHGHMSLRRVGNRAAVEDVHAVARGICHGKCLGKCRETLCGIILSFPQHMKHESALEFCCAFDFVLVPSAQGPGPKNSPESAFRVILGLARSILWGHSEPGAQQITREALSGALSGRGCWALLYVAAGIVTWWVQRQSFAGFSLFGRF